MTGVGLWGAASRSAFERDPNGIPGIETRLPLLYSEGVLAGRMTLNRFVELTSTGPAKSPTDGFEAVRLSDRMSGDGRGRVTRPSISLPHC